MIVALVLLAIVMVAANLAFTDYSEQDKLSRKIKRMSKNADTTKTELPDDVDERNYIDSKYPRMDGGERRWMNHDV